MSTTLEIRANLKNQNVKEVKEDAEQVKDKADQPLMSAAGKGRREPSKSVSTITVQFSIGNWTVISY